MEDTSDTVFQQFRKSKPVLKLGNFLKNKLRPKSNSRKEDKSNRWTKGIQKKRKTDYNSPINKLRRQQTRNWAEGGIYGKAMSKNRKSKRILKPKGEESSGKMSYLFYCFQNVFLMRKKPWTN